ncbi:COP9 signalosome (CSN) subunit [Chytridiales sp. JEL 0842]|nr:COP9 signalosome (CSN) subunit [Chytridiales sp. JEL 0842]
MPPPNPQKTITTYINALNTAIRNEDGLALAELLNTSETQAQKIKLVFSAQSPDTFDLSLRKIESGWSEVVNAHWRVLRSLAMDDIIEAFTEQNLVAQNLHKLLVNVTRWALPVLYIVNSELRILAIKADEELRKQGQKATCLEETARTMNKAFSVSATDRYSSLEFSRKWGAYFVVNLLFKTYFKLRQINLGENLLKSLRSADLPELHQYPIAHVVTFQYYTGVMAFYSEHYKKAEEHLMFCLQRCRAKGPNPTVYKKNKGLILNYLIPARLLAGHVPHPDLLKKYPTLQRTYGGLIDAVGKGDVGGFDKILAEKERELIRRGTYLAVERCRFMCFRNLARRTWVIKEKANRIEFSAFQTAVRTSGVKNVEMEEIECMLANLIDKGLMKGYMSHEKLTLVLSNKDPFPSATSVQL